MVKMTTSKHNLNSIKNVQLVIQEKATWFSSPIPKLSRLYQHFGLVIQCISVSCDLNLS